MNLYGTPVYVSNILMDIPKVGISPNFPWASPEFIKKFNDELGEMFGYMSVCFRTETSIFVSPKTYEALRDNYASMTMGEKCKEVV